MPADACMLLGMPALRGTIAAPCIAATAPHLLMPAARRPNAQCIPATVAHRRHPMPPMPMHMQASWPPILPGATAPPRWCLSRQLRGRSLTPSVPDTTTTAASMPPARRGAGVRKRAGRAGRAAPIVVCCGSGSNTLRYAAVCCCRGNPSTDHRRPSFVEKQRTLHLSHCCRRQHRRPAGRGFGRPVLSGPSPGGGQPYICVSELRHLPRLRPGAGALRPGLVLGGELNGQAACIDWLHAWLGQSV